MARYTCFLTIAISIDRLMPLMDETLKSCNLNVIYTTEDYMMAKETPGKVPFPKLVTAEVLVDRTTATEQEVKLSVVLKNEELPLQVDNHCRQVFDSLQQAVTANEKWRLIENVTG